MITVFYLIFFVGIAVCFALVITVMVYAAGITVAVYLLRLVWYGICSLFCFITGKEMPTPPIIELKQGQLNVKRNKRKMQNAKKKTKKFVADNDATKCYNELVEMAEQSGDYIYSTTDKKYLDKFFDVWSFSANAFSELETKIKKFSKAQKKFDFNIPPLEPSLFGAFARWGFIFFISFLFFHSYRMNGDYPFSKISEYVQQNVDLSQYESSRIQLFNISVEKHKWIDSYVEKIPKTYGSKAIPIIWYMGSVKSIFINATLFAPIYFLITKKHKRKKYERKLAKFKTKYASMMEVYEDAKKELEQYVKDNKEILNLVPAWCYFSETLWDCICFYKVGKISNYDDLLALVEKSYKRDDKSNYSREYSHPDEIRYNYNPKPGTTGIFNLARKNYNVAVRIITEDSEYIDNSVTLVQNTYNESQKAVHNVFSETEKNITTPNDEYDAWKPETYVFNFKIDTLEHWKWYKRNVSLED